MPHTPLKMLLAIKKHIRRCPLIYFYEFGICLCEIQVTIRFYIFWRHSVHNFVNCVVSEKSQQRSEGTAMTSIDCWARKNRKWDDSNAWNVTN